MADFDAMRTQMKEGAGFIAALDQSGGSTPKALALYGVDAGDYDGEDAMFAEIQRMRARIMQASDFTKAKVIGTILFEKTLHEAVDGMKVPEFLWSQKGIVPFLKIDKGLEETADGVQVMKPIPGLAETLAVAKLLGIFGTKERSVIHEADAGGIARIVANQMDVANVVLDAGMVPIIEPEVNIKSATKAEAEDLLEAELKAAIDALPDGAEVMLKLTLPTKPGLYDTLSDHPKVLRVVALSGGYSTEEACALLAKNPKMIASFSRALTEGLQRSMSDDEFGAALGQNIDQIYQASVAA
ncbi:MAG: fructose bisphosphate aldolase [Pseudomonadota bacterium]